MSACVICYNDENEYISCLQCQNNTCISCLNIYKKIECPSCLEDYPDVIFKPFYKKNKDLYINYYIYKRLKYDDQTNIKIVNYFKKMEIKKKIYWGERINIEGSTAFTCCKKCSGIILETGICLKCKYRICVYCEEEYHEGSDCRKEALEAIEEIRKTCKKCPCCYAYIYRIEGCPHMNCSYCGASFDWNNPKIIQKDQYKYKKLTNIYINKELYDKYTKEYDALYNKQKTHNKSELAIITNCSTESIERFVLNLSRDYKEVKKQIDDLSVEYFTLIRDELEKCQDEEHTQIDINYFIERKFMNKLYITLKKQEYFLEINKQMKTNNNQDKASLEKIFDEIKDNKIVPEDILLFFDKDGIEIVNIRTSLAKKKIKKEKVYEYNELEEAREITLLNQDQVKHVEGVYNILKKYRMCLNTSHAGSGKTYTSLYIANKLKISTLIVFSPKIMEYKWNDVITRYNQSYKFNTICFTYSEISSTNFTTNNNIYKTVLQNNRIAIQLNPDFIIKLTPQTMIIYDEIHNIKSPSTKAFKFIEQLSHVAFEKGSYILSLSATPIEKSVEICQLSKKISFLLKFDNISFEFDPFIVFNKDKKIAQNINPEQNSDITEESNYSNTFSHIESAIRRNKTDLDALFSNIKSNTNTEESSTCSNLDEPSTSGINDYKSKEDDTILGSPYQDEARALDPEIYLRRKEIESTIRYLCISIRENYNKLIKHFNQPDYRNKRITLVVIIKNIIKNNINLSEFCAQICQHKNIKKYNIFVDKQVLKFINLQSNFKIYFILLYRYILYLSKSIKKVIFGERATITAFILVLYGFDIIDAITLSFRFPITALADEFKEKIFNLKTFNILASLNRKQEIEIYDMKLLDITLNQDDFNRLDSAFEKVLIKIDAESEINLETFSLITKGLIISELVYINYLVEIILSIIMYDNIKIVVGLHYKETMGRFKTIFTEMGIDFIAIDGDVRNKEILINSFQTNKNKKLLIVNIKSINSGIDLDDKIGTERRVVFIIPDFKFSETIQFMYRFKRLDSKSEPLIFLINNHLKILNVLLIKNILNKRINTSLPDLESLEKITERDIQRFIPY